MPADFLCRRAEPGRYPHFDHHFAESLAPLPPGAADHPPYWLQSHVDLRPLRPTPAAGPGERSMRHNSVEQVVVEYSQDGGVLFTTGDSSCPAVAALLALERGAGSYLDGIAPKRLGARGPAAVSAIRWGGWFILLLGEPPAACSAG